MPVIRFTLNEEPVSVVLAGDEKLLDVLRGTLHLTGTKRGCESGTCGSCTVIVDGKTRRSCHVKAVDVAGRSVETIEGLAKDGVLHPVQRAFLATGAVQCGFCTPGMIMAVKALLDEKPDASVSEIKKALRRNICRCTGYANILQGVRVAQSILSGHTGGSEFLQDGTVGDDVVDREGVEKVSGALRFADDYVAGSPVIGRLVWSDLPHARIVAVHRHEAAKVPGVLAVLTAADIPGRNGIGWFRADQPALASDRVRYVGDAVALVLAEDEQSAEAGRAAVLVDYEPLPVVASPHESLADTTPDLYPHGNLLKRFGYEQGDVEAALDGAEVVVTGRFITPFVEHAYLETESAVAEWGDDGIVTVHTGTQYPFEAQEHISSILDIPLDKVRVVVTPIGGAFGGKTDIHPCIPLAALAARHLRRTVKITLSRSESLRSSTKRHAYDMSYRVGFAADGRILGVTADLLSDAGPYTGQSDQVIEQACIFACGPYLIPAFRVKGTAVYTNNALGGAFRGYGINQVAFAIESLIDEAAAILGMDPLQLRILNGLRQGESTAAGERLRGHVGVVGTLEALTEPYERAKGTPASRAGWRRGVGVATAYKNVGWGRGSVDTGAARLRLEADGRLLVLAAAPDMGQGIRTGLAQILTNVLGLHKEDVEFGPLDTLGLPACNGGSAQRLMFCTGNAVLQAANLFKDELVTVVQQRFGAGERSSIRVGGRSITFPLDGGEVRTVTYSDVASALGSEGSVLEIEHVYTAPKTFSLRSRGEIPDDDLRFYPAYSYTSALAVVEVEEATGKVEVVNMVVCQDVGKAINPKIIEGQIHGCCLQALGYALSEEYPLVNGIPESLSYARLGVPTIEDAPAYEVILLESADEHGPLGARGISEVAMVPACPAITNAVAVATGRRIHALPVKRAEWADPFGS